jgi:hypothetical protein
LEDLDKAVFLDWTVFVEEAIGVGFLALGFLLEGAIDEYKDEMIGFDEGDSKRRTN